MEGRTSERDGDARDARARVGLRRGARRKGRAEKEARGPPTRLRESVGWGAEWTRMRGESMSVWEEEEQESSP